MSDTQRGKASATSLRRLLGEYRQYKWLTVVTVTLSVTAVVAELLPGFFTRTAIKHIEEWIRAGGTVSLSVLPFAVLILVSTVIQNLLRFSQIMVRTELGTRITNGFSERMYSAIQRHSLGYHRRSSTGDLISRSTRDINSINRFMSFAIFAAADLVVFLTGAVALLIWINPVFALVALAPVPFAIYLTVTFGTQSRSMWLETSEQYGRVTTVLQENIAGARVVRSFAQEESETGKFASESEKYLVRMVSTIRFWVWRTVSANFVLSLVMPIALVYGAYAAINGWISIGDIMLCFFYMRNIQQRLYGMVGLVELFQTAAAGSDRVYEILDEEPDIVSRKGAPVLPRLKSGAEVEFRNVSFCYKSGKQVLQEISFVARPGETIGIVGHTGSGKSTLVSLIPRFHHPDGQVFVNGLNVREVDLRSLRRATGIIFQETFLFNASVRDNIAYGRPDADLDTIVGAATAAQAHEFIKKLEDGYDTEVGERGVTLSGGQAQRLAIARAVLLDPGILIMDDATANVDAETERQIRETLRQVSKNRTTFIIAHRMSSVAHADRVLVLDGGRVVEEGPPAELYAKGGTYRVMCDQQSGVTQDFFG